MNTTTGLIAGILVAGSFGAVLATSGTALFDGDASATVEPRTGAAFEQVQATIRTEWLAPVSARRSLEQRHEALERWVAERGGYVRVLDTASALRTRGDGGARLRIPVAQIERTLLIAVPEHRSATDLEQALAGLDITVAAFATDAESLEAETFAPEVIHSRTKF
jgi:precorrin-2 methylase